MSTPAPINFELFSALHWLILCISAAVPAGLGWLINKFRSAKLVTVAAWTLGGTLLVNDILFYSFSWHIEGTQVFLRQDLPLHMCGLSGILAIVMLFTRRRFLFEIVYYLGLVGATVAIITPDISPKTNFLWILQFFVRHGGIICAAVFAVVGFGYYPRKHSAWKVFGIMNLWMILAGYANYRLGSNYMYLARHPEVNTPLNYIAWPYYILVCEAAIIALFIGLELLFRKKAERLKDAQPLGLPH